MVEEVGLCVRQHLLISLWTYFTNVFLLRPADNSALETGMQTDFRAPVSANILLTRKSLDEALQKDTEKGFAFEWVFAAE